MTVTSRLEGLETHVAIKAPCRVATTANITLSGLQTIDGVTLASGDRVLVKNQSTASANGIWVAGSGDWERALDFNGSRDAVGGTQVAITSGSTNGDTYWKVDGSGSVNIGTDSIVFAAAVISESSAVSWDEGGTGASAMTLLEALRSGALFASFYGVRASNSAATNVTKLNLLTARASALGKAIIFTEYCPANANIIVPVGLGSRVSFYGMGDEVGIEFDGTAVDKGLYFNKSSSPAGTYDHSGIVRDMKFGSINGAKRAITFENVNHPGCYNVETRNFAGTAIKYLNCLVGSHVDCLDIGSGSATEFAIVVDGDDALTSGSTDFTWARSRISGGLGSGVATKAGGLSIDCCVNVSIAGGTIESVGLPIRIGGKTASTRPCQNVIIDGALGIENPGNGNPYIDIGSGWTLSNSSGVQRLRLGNMNCSPSGTNSMPSGVKIQHSIGFEASSTAQVIPHSSAATTFDFSGAYNEGAIVRANRSSYGNAQFWVRENGTQRVDASPYKDWFSVGGEQLKGVRKSITNPGTAYLDPYLFAAQGGICGILNLFNTGATNYDGILQGYPGAEIVIVARDGNATLRHNIAGGGGGAKIIWSGGANKTLTQDLPYRLFWDATNSTWSQFG